jgi:outer membrane lipoprotein-sorting protein
VSRSLRDLLLAGAALATLALAGPVRADDRQDLHQAYRKMMSLTRFKATMVELPSGKTVMTMEYQAPDRYRMSMPGQPPQLIIGDTMVMTMNGQTMRVPMPKGSLPKMRNEDALREIEKGSLVTSEGMGAVGGQPARIYRHTTQVNGKPGQTLVWVGVASGLPLQVETRGAGSKNGVRGKDVRLLYSDFNSPKIRIDAPK